MSYVYESILINDWVWLGREGGGWMAGVGKKGTFKYTFLLFNSV